MSGVTQKTKYTVFSVAWNKNASVLGPTMAFSVVNKVEFTQGGVKPCTGPDCPEEGNGMSLVISLFLLLELLI